MRIKNRILILATSTILSSGGWYMGLSSAQAQAVNPTPYPAQGQINSYGSGNGNFVSPNSNGAVNPYANNSNFGATPQAYVAPVNPSRPYINTTNQFGTNTRTIAGVPVENRQNSRTIVQPLQNRTNNPTQFGQQASYSQQGNYNNFSRPVNGFSQNASVQNAKPSGTPPGLAASIKNSKVGPDIQALRYYAKQGNTKRYEAELLRLREIYPNFIPPVNIFADPAVEEKPFWDMYAAGKFDLIRAEIERKKQAEPGWSPSETLTSKLILAESRKEIGAAIAEGRWKEVIEIADLRPQLLSSEDIELVWYIGEAFGRLGKFDRARATFEAAFAISSDDDLLTATLHKSAILLPLDDIEDLYNQAVGTNENTERRINIAMGLVRGILERILENGQKFPARFSWMLEKFRERTLESKKRKDVGMLAWASYRQQNYEDAVIWFSQLEEERSDAKYIEGKILSLKLAGKISEALEVVTRWFELNEETKKLYVNLASTKFLQEKPAALPTKFLVTYASITSQLASGEGAEALAWYAFNVGQYGTAAAWFNKAILWEETEARVYGLALTAWISGKRDRFNTIKIRYSARYERIAEMDPSLNTAKASGQVETANARKRNSSGGSSSSITRAYQARNYRRCIQLSSAKAKRGRLSAQDYQMRGWCYMKLDRPAEAQEAFAFAVRGGGKGRADSAYGESLAALQMGKTNRALNVANTEKLAKQNRRIIDLEILVQRARAAFAKGDYHSTIYALNARQKMTREPRDLGFLRGWALYHSGYKKRAESVFAALDGHVSTADSREALAFVTRRKNAEREGKDG